MSKPRSRPMGVARRFALLGLLLAVASLGSMVLFEPFTGGWLSAFLFGNVLMIGFASALRSMIGAEGGAGQNKR